MEESDDGGEVIRSCKSLQKHALLQEGSRDVSAQLFTALCRSLDIPARLIVSIQSVPWKASLRKDPAEHRNAAKSESPKPQIDRKGKGKAVFPGDGQTPSGRTPEPEDKTPPPTIKLRSGRSQGRRLQNRKGNSFFSRNTGFNDLKRFQVHPPPPLGYPPTQWTEVFSRADGRWIPVDPIRAFVDKKGLFEPPDHDKRNRMVYVLAFEEDGFIRDVTQRFVQPLVFVELFSYKLSRYAREFNRKTSKLRLGGRGKKEWWDNIISFLSRPYRLVCSTTLLRWSYSLTPSFFRKHRDDIEDAELQSLQVIEGMPTSVVAFKDHPMLVFNKVHVFTIKVNLQIRPRAARTS